MINIYKKVKVSHALLFIILLSLVSGLFKDVITLFLIIIIHEIGHIIASLIFKWKISKITFSITGGYITYDEEIDKPFIEEFIISIAGFFMQLLIFMLSFILFKVNVIDSNIYYMINNYNISIFLFNLIPIYPLDGSKILSIFLNIYFPYKKALKITNILSIIIIIIIILLFIFKYFKIEYSYIMILVFLIKKIYANVKNTNFMFHKFLFERYKSPIKVNKYNYVNSSDINKFKRGCKNFFYIDNYYHSERSILNKMFD